MVSRFFGNIVLSEHNVSKKAILFHSVSVGQTGKEALEQMQVVSPALVLMDIHLPAIDGLEVIQHRWRDAAAEYATLCG
jgi:CheY-like chemotaxis protein